MGQSRARSVYGLRMSASERHILEAAAAKRNELLSEYLRRVAMEAARRDLRLPMDAP